jgi:ribulose-bisphosphate carboxylase small chain
VRLTQGCFSFLPDLTDQQIEKQIAYCINKGWAMNVEWTDDPHPRNSYWATVTPTSALFGMFFDVTTTF